MQIGQVQGFTIASGGVLSNAVMIEGPDKLSICVPTAATTAAFTFQGSHDGIKFYELIDKAGTAVTCTGAAPAKCISFAATDIPGVKFLKIRSGTVATGIVQTGGIAGTIYTKRPE